LTRRLEIGYSLPLALTLALGLGVAGGFLLQGCQSRVSVADKTGQRPIFSFDPENEAGPCLRLSGLSDGELKAARGREVETWREILPVLTEVEALRGSRDGSSPEAGTPLLGSYSVQNHEIFFRPRFPFEEGSRYVARWLGTSDFPPTELTFALPKQEIAPSTQVKAIYPRGANLPENLLRLYIQFSAPMSRGEASHYLRLTNAAGDPIPGPFLQMPYELWNPAADRLTLFLDPGRVKRGVGPNLQVGAPLSADQEYRLVVDAGWPDAQGIPLVKGFEKRFRVGPADRSSPDPSRWKVEAVPVDETTEIHVALAEPVDHALGLRLIWLEDGSGARVPGDTSLTQEESLWIFRPREALLPGGYALVVAPELEDSSGNSLRRPFETEVADESEAISPTPPFRLAIELPLLQH